MRKRQKRSQGGWAMEKLGLAGNSDMAKHHTDRLCALSSSSPTDVLLVSSSAGRFITQKSLAPSPAFPMLTAERHRLFGHKDLLYLMRSKRAVSLEIIMLPPVTEERAIPRTQQRQLVNGNPYWK